MNDLRVSLVQGDTRWHDPAANREYYGRLVAPLAGRTDLVLLPETFTSGFSNEAIDQAEAMDGPTVRWLREQARALDAAVTGSVQLRVDGGVYNRLLFATPDGGSPTTTSATCSATPGSTSATRRAARAWWWTGAAGGSARWSATTCASRCSRATATP